jgi:hypothetical protein
MNLFFAELNMMVVNVIEVLLGVVGVVVVPEIMQVVMSRTEKQCANHAEARA